MKTCKNTTAAFFIMCLILTIGSCNKDKGGETVNYRTVSQYTISGGTPYYSSYFYDMQGRIEKILGSQIYSYLTYQTDSVLYQEYRTDGGLNNTYKLKLDGSGRIIYRNGASYLYNADGKLTREFFASDTGRHYDYTWQNGDLTEARTTVGGVLGYTTYYTYYTDHENKAHWDYNHSGFNCFYGQDSKHLIKHTKSVQESNGSFSETDWTYEFNDRGLPIKMNIIFVGQNLVNTYSYTYESY